MPPSFLLARNKKFAPSFEELSSSIAQARRPLGPWDEEHLQVAEDDSYANAMEMTEMVDLRAERAWDIASMYVWVGGPMRILVGSEFLECRAK